MKRYAAGLAAFWLAACGWLLAATAPPRAPDPAAPFGAAAAVALAHGDALAAVGPVEQKVREVLALPAGKARDDLLGPLLESLHDLRGYRYFYFDCDAADLPKRRAAFQLAVNLLSRYSLPIEPEYLHPRLCRLDVDLPGWDRAVLEAAQHVDVFLYRREEVHAPARFVFHWPGGAETRGPQKGKAFKAGTFEADFKPGEYVPVAQPDLPAEEMKRLQALLGTQVPVLNAQWLLVQSARQISLRNDPNEGLGYYDFWRIRKRQDFFDAVVFSREGAERLGKKLKAVQEFSGVSPTPRTFERDNAQSGPLWVALDVLNATGRGVAIRNLKPGQLLPKLEEWYGRTALGLPLTPLFNDKGEAQNNAPGDGAGFGDDSPLNESRDKRIHVNLACLRCHAGQVLRPIDDWISDTYQLPAGLGDKRKANALRLQKEYFGNLAEEMGEDRLLFQRAFRRATTSRDYPRGLDAQTAVELYARAFHAYADDPVTLETSARELGLTEAAWEAKLKWVADEVKVMDARLAPLVRLPAEGGRPAKKSRPIHRLTWEDAYDVAVEIKHGRVPQLRKPRP